MTETKHDLYEELIQEYFQRTLQIVGEGEGLFDAKKLARTQTIQGGINKAQTIDDIKAVLRLMADT